MFNKEDYIDLLKVDDYVCKGYIFILREIPSKSFPGKAWSWNFNR